MAVRAKFRVSSVTMFGTSREAQRLYTFHAVHDNSTPENERFTRYTPSGELKMTVDNPDVEFVPGQEFYLDFTPVSE